MLHLSIATLVLLQAAPARPPQPAPPPVAQPQPTPTAPPTSPPPTTTPAQPTDPATQPTPTYPTATQPPIQPTQPSPPAEPTAQPSPPAEPSPASPPAEPTAQPSPPAEPSPAPPPAQPGYQYPYTPYPPPPAIKPPTPELLPEDVTHRRLVFANFYALNFSLAFPVPSGDFSFFLGTNLRPRKNAGRTWDWNTAIGYQLTLSLGGADIIAYENGRYRQSDASFVHRHHLTAMGIGGAKQRLFFALGGGAWFALEQLAGVEAEGRLGYVFSRPEGKRVKGIVGGQARLSGAFEGVPIPQIGAFIGYMIF